MSDSGLTGKQMSIYSKRGQGEKEGDTNTERVRERNKEKKKRNKEKEREIEGGREEIISPYCSVKYLSPELCRTQ